MGGATIFREHLSLLEVIEFITNELMNDIEELGLSLRSIVIEREEDFPLYSVYVRVHK